MLTNIIGGRKEFMFTDPEDNSTFYGTELLTIGDTSLEQRLSCDYDPSAPPQIIFTRDFVGTLGGCPDWNCVISEKNEDVPRAGAIVTYMGSNAKSYSAQSDQYLIHYSQESPIYTPYTENTTAFNMTLGFSHDSPITSPYGYTVRLAEKSRRSLTRKELNIINGKTKEAAWFVSHCDTSSGRFEYYAELQKYIPVDVFGTCGTLRCNRGTECENQLDTTYHFYLSFENSMCNYYMTEKLWKHGYMHLVVPVVLRRSIVEPFVPPYSFLAVDDFSSPKELAEYMYYLIANKTAYLEYFKWRSDYRVVFLNGENHNNAERPWGLCQLCRLLWETPRKRYQIDIEARFFQTCEEKPILDLLPPVSRFNYSKLLRS
ncbi:hypothetical protein Q1695_011600 [Nippostrongylus brasiliensis]|nr:hypothetical protein Q1695_011600 [Nippostrongylus brasiliensis]